MTLQHINLSDLKIAPINVRKIGGKDIADLVPSIRSLGLLQPLLVRPNCEGFEIIAGQRRFHALSALAEEGMIDPVPCIIMKDGDDAKAIEASLAENIARLPMDEIDQYKAFAALIKQGGTVEGIASQFGITERLVKQRLAIANLIAPLLTAYRKGEIDPQTLRLLTLATSRQQKAWLALLRSDDEYAPQGYRLKCWLFGGAEISTDAALFDMADYTGNIVSDLFGEQSYFDSAEEFWALQNTAIAKLKEDYLANGWGEVIVLDIGEHFPSWEYVDTANDNGGKVYIVIARNGEVTPYEGQLSRKDIKARDKATQSGEGMEAEAASLRPELTKPMQNYLDLHRHSAVRAELLNHSQIALRLIAAQAIAGSDTFAVRADPQKAERKDIAESVASNTAQTRFADERNAIAALLGLDEDGSVEGSAERAHGLPLILSRLLCLVDEDITRILTFIAAETLPSGASIVEALGIRMKVDIAKDWQPDEAFFDLLRDKEAINGIVKEVAGKAAADAHITSTAKVQKGIIRDCLTGQRQPIKKDWTPRYVRFPMTAYTKRGGIRAIDEWQAVKKHFA